MTTTHAFIGNLAGQPKRADTASGKVVTRARIACDDVGRNSEGKLVKRPTVFHSIEAWGDAAQRLADLPSGSPVLLTGTFRSSSYTTEAGEQRTRTYISVQAIGPNIAHADVTVHPRTKPAGNGADTAAAEYSGRNNGAATSTSAAAAEHPAPGANEPADDDLGFLDDLG